MVAVDDVVVYRFNRFREYDNMGEVALTIGYAQATTLEKDEMRRELADMNVAALQVSSKSRIASRRSHHVGTALHTNNHAWCNHTSTQLYYLRYDQPIFVVAMFHRHARIMTVSSNPRSTKR